MPAAADVAAAAASLRGAGALVQESGDNVIATDPVHKATIIPRGRALGMVMQLPERDKLSPMTVGVVNNFGDSFILAYPQIRESQLRLPLDRGVMRPVSLMSHLGTFGCS